MKKSEKIIEELNKKIYPRKINYKFNSIANDWSKKYKMKTIRKAINIGSEAYLKYDEDGIVSNSIGDFLEKLGGILCNLDKSPIEQKINHICNTLPYKFEFYDKLVTKEVLNDYVRDIKDVYSLNDNKIVEILEEELNEIAKYKGWNDWIDHFNLNIKKSGKIKTIKDLRDYICINGIDTLFGRIENIDRRIGQGGNSIVCFGTLNEECVAIKILTNCDSNKKNRFYLEYYNLITKVINYEGIVHQYFLDKLIIEDSEYPFIVMKKYESQLKYNEDLSIEQLFEYIFELIKPLKYLHGIGIIHRDLKPQNILIDELGHLNIADFGIAYFDPDEFVLTGHTVDRDRLANFDFSAPEQRNSKIEPTPQMDIYAFGQIIHWLVYAETNKGTNRQKLYKKLKDKRIKMLDKVVDKCLSNNPNERYNSFEEIEYKINEIIK